MQIVEGKKTDWFIASKSGRIYGSFEDELLARRAIEDKVKHGVPCRLFRADTTFIEL